jgi:plastocyanin
VCTFTGGNDLESSGPIGPAGPGTLDWSIAINASPGTYTMYCTIHPGMKGTIHVVPAGHWATTQSQVDAASAVQFASEQASALAAEQQAQKPDKQREDGHTTWTVKVGISAADGKVAIDEMLPQNLTIKPGDSVRYDWADFHNIHSVTFPAIGNNDPSPFGFDCTAGFTPPSAGPPCTEASEAPEFILDPGNAPPGTLLSTANPGPDSGVLVGSGYGVPGSVESWSARTAHSAPSGTTYTYHCIIHDFMTGSVAHG